MVTTVIVTVFVIVALLVCATLCICPNAILSAIAVVTVLPLELFAITKMFNFAIVIYRYCCSYGYDKDSGFRVSRTGSSALISVFSGWGSLIIPLKPKKAPFFFLACTARSWVRASGAEPLQPGPRNSKNHKTYP